MGTFLFRVPLMETLHCELMWLLVIHGSSWLYLRSLEILEQTTLVPHGVCHYQNSENGIVDPLFRTRGPNNVPTIPLP